jgi:hypothetical protein
VFGPVLAVTPFDTEAEALHLANATDYGLAAGVWTLKANNARSLWHPMTAPSDSLKNPPTIVTGAQGVRITRYRRA